VQELSVPRCKKSDKEVKRPAWLSQDLLVKLKAKRELHRQWKHRQLSWEEYMDAASSYRDVIRKDKARMEQNFARDTKHKKGFYRYENQKKKVKNTYPS